MCLLNFFQIGNFLFDVLSKIFNVTLVSFSQKRTNSLAIQVSPCNGNVKEIQGLLTSLSNEITPNAPSLQVLYIFLFSLFLSFLFFLVFFIFYSSPSLFISHSTISSQFLFTLTSITFPFPPQPHIDNHTQIITLILHMHFHLPLLITPTSSHHTPFCFIHFHSFSFFALSVIFFKFF